MKTRMKKLREELHLTQEQLANRVGVRRETILFLEKGKYNPSLKLAYSIAKVLKSRIEDIFVFEDWELGEGHQLTQEQLKNKEGARKMC
ncbi:MAG: helix-turn-helix transcriptional regulator [Promethearchaeati archaeon SRVP18_Atabeyarchaeia-1]